MPNIDGTSNVFLTDDLILREALRMLENELVATRLVNRSTEQKFGAEYKIGDTISVKKPYRVKSASGRTLVKQPMVDLHATMKVGYQEHVGLSFNMIDRTLSLNEFSERYIKSAVAQLAHKVDLSILQEAVRTTFHATGVPGNAFHYDVGIDARAEATMLGVPDDGKNSILLNPRDGAHYLKALTQLHNPEMVKAAIERAYRGNIAGMDAFESAQLPVHTVGAYAGTPLVNGAAQTGSTLVTDGWSNSITGLLKVGDIFTIAGVFSINPQTYQSTGMLQQFVVTADAASNGSGQSTLAISPEINPGTLTTTDASGATVSLAAYQNVSNAPADNAPITVLGTASTAYRQNLMLHKDAVTLAIVDIALPSSAVVAKRARHDKSGISIAMTAGYDITNYEETYRLDILWGVKNWYPELSRRIYGRA